VSASTHPIDAFRLDEQGLVAELEISHR